MQNDFAARASGLGKFDSSLGFGQRKNGFDARFELAALDKLSNFGQLFGVWLNVNHRRLNAKLLGQLLRWRADGAHQKPALFQSLGLIPRSLLRIEKVEVRLEV